MAEESKGAPEEKAAAKGGSKLVLILLGVNMLLVVGVLALFLLKGGLGGQKAPAAGEEKGEAAHGEAAAGDGHGGAGGVDAGPTSKMADFVVHLRDAEVDKAKLERYTPRVRDGFIAYLSDRTLEELRGGEQIKKQKTALLEQLKELAPGVKVRALYVTDLVIQ